MGRVVGWPLGSHPRPPAGLVPYVFLSGGRPWVWVVSAFWVYGR